MCPGMPRSALGHPFALVPEEPVTELGMRQGELRGLKWSDIDLKQASSKCTARSDASKAWVSSKVNLRAASPAAH